MVRIAKRYKSQTLLTLGVVILAGLFRMAPTHGAGAPGLTRTHSGGGVTVKATYLDSKETEDVRFQVVLDTHSVDLDKYDLKVLSLLRDDSGKTDEPTAVENRGSGHHRQITLVFPRSSPDARNLELVIKDVAEVKERAFRWDVAK